MKQYYKHHVYAKSNTECEFTILKDKVLLENSIQKTREALEVAYTGFDNATEPELIDSYIFEINALQKRYQFLLEQFSTVPKEQRSNQHASIRTLVRHVFG